MKISAVGILLALCVPLQSVAAQTVLEKVAKTGVLTAGTSKDAFPLAYADDKGQLVGYSVDMLQLIKTQVERELKRPITLKLVALSPGERIPKLQTGEVDIVCDSSSFTWERDKLIDFSVSYGITGTRLLVKRDTTFAGPESLAGKRIGALPKTTNEDSIRRAQPKAQIVLFKDRAEGYKALQEGKIDAFAGDGLLLEGWLQKNSNTKNYQVDGYPYSKEGIACMVPENNSKLLDRTNYALLSFMQGFVKNNPSSVSTFDKWFGPNSSVPLTEDLRNLVKESMQSILDMREEMPDSAT
ncbi:amino acid ABC transporter substrate-binding protein [Altericista sp. CCNU0014]|uniref:amino acid ABC transporter substrate-binding protein n=1 Tax=Altericista sp. CCNU0014 TaxID=3082949 RepID=UPI00384BEEE6